MTLTEDRVVAREAARRDAIVAADKAALGAILSDGLIWTHATGGTDSKASYLAGLGAKARFVSIEPTTEHVRILGSAAVIKSELAMVIKPNAGEPITLRSFALGVWAVEEDGELRLTHFQSGTMA